MKKLDISKQEKNTLDDAISHWEDEGLIDSAQAAKLRNTYDARGFDWTRLAKYSFWVALACAVLAVLSLLLDEIIQRWIERIYNAPDVLVCLFFFALSALFYALGFRHKRKNPDKM